MAPASIRYKNPGAMWGGNTISKRWGELGNVALHDGTGQNNHIAVFPDYVHGICAQIALWRTARYHNKPFSEAIRIWCGGNSVLQYIDFVRKHAPGMTANTMMDDKLLSSPLGAAFLKAQAWHEAGQKYPAPDEDWVEAQRRVFGGKVTATVKKATVPVIAGGSAAVTAASNGVAWPWIIGIAVVVAAIAFFVWKYRPRAAVHPEALRPEVAAPIVLAPAIPTVT